VTRRESVTVQEAARRHCTGRQFASNAQRQDQAQISASEHGTNDNCDSSAMTHHHVVNCRPAILIRRVALILANKQYNNNI